MKVVSLFGRPVPFLVLLPMGLSDTFLVANRKHRPHPSSLESPPVPAGASLSEGVCDRVPRINGVEAARVFFRMPRGSDSRHLVLQCTNMIHAMLC